MHKTRIDISAETRDKIISLLNARLADSMDLKSQAKQAHWNVKGMSFISLHELFDQVATEVEAYTDMIAERVTVLGGTAEWNREEAVVDDAAVARILRTHRSFFAGAAS